LGSIGKDLGGAVKGFRKAMSDVEKADEQAQLDEPDAEFSEASNEDLNVKDTEDSRSS
jgi:sec-independent protein translocase protein TatA